jgi:hypothetical protein
MVAADETQWASHQFGQSLNLLSEIGGEPQTAVDQIPQHHHLVGLHPMHQRQQGVESGPIAIAWQGHPEALKHFRLAKVQIGHQQELPLRIPDRPLGQQL